MTSNALLKKLLIKPGQRLIILNPPAGYWDELGSLPADVDVATQPEGHFDLVQLFVKDSAELSQWSSIALQIVKPHGILWITYPKGTAKVKTDLNRDILWKLMEPTGWRPVTLVAVNAIWSAMRFRPLALVGA